MEIMIFILQCLVILLIFAVYDKVSNKNNIIEQNQPNPKNPKEMEIFTNGMKQSWLHVNISLFKMWNDLDILDFDTMRGKLQENLEFLAENPDELNNWSQKFKSYIEEQEHGNKN